MVHIITTGLKVKKTLTEIRMHNSTLRNAFIRPVYIRNRTVKDQKMTFLPPVLYTESKSSIKYRYQEISKRFIHSE